MIRNHLERNENENGNEEMVCEDTNGCGVEKKCQSIFIIIHMYMYTSPVLHSYMQQFVSCVPYPILQDLNYPDVNVHTYVHACICNANCNA